jgi:hypothetical protein
MEVVANKAMEVNKEVNKDMVVASKAMEVNMGVSKDMEEEVNKGMEVNKEVWEAWVETGITSTMSIYLKYNSIPTVESAMDLVLSRGEEIQCPAEIV